MNSKNSLCGLFMAVVLQLGMLAGSAQDAYSTNADGSIYTYSTNADGSANIVAYAGPPWVVTIPTNINGLTVTSIGVLAFENDSLTSVTIPGSVTSIGNYAFVGCTNLTSVTIPNSITNIGNYAFGFCKNLTSITVDASNSAYSSMNGVLFDKAQATLLQFPGGLGGSYTITNSVTSIGDEAFAYCPLTSVTIPNSVTSIGSYAFGGCGLTSVTIPNSVTSIGSFGFFFCTNLTSVTIPNSVTSIGDNAFAECYSLINVTIPGSVTSIGEGAFSFCSSLTNATIDNGVISIGEQAFFVCTSLTSVHFTGNAPSPTNDSTVFSSYGNSLDPATVYYLPGTTGWGAMFDGLPTAPWFLPNPLILTHSASFGVQPGGFGFTISWATNASVVVEAATNLANPVWIPVSTNNTLTGGTNYFSDPQWTNYPMRFYRAASAFTVGGTLTGLPAGDTVTLQDNGSDNLTLSNNGTFTFPTALPDGQSYSVTFSRAGGGTSIYPPVTANYSGTISGANVTNVAVQCTSMFTGNLDVDMYNAAVADGTANGGVPAVMGTENGGPFRVTASGRSSNAVCRYYSEASCVFTTVVGTYSCSSTTLPSGTPVIQFGTVLECGFGPYHY
jgi:BspA type Leucine rich repeat region (6 copies)